MWNERENLADPVEKAVGIVSKWWATVDSALDERR